MPNQNLLLIAVNALTLLGGLAIVFRASRLRGTTLIPPLSWTFIALATLSGGEMLVTTFATADGLPAWSSAVRLITATCTFCPVMAVLGARRPQHHAWQFVVVTMWIMLSLPAWEALFLTRWEGMDVGPVRGWFLWLMLIVNLIAYLPTRFFVASLLTAAGQLVLLSPFLPGLHVDHLHPIGPAMAAFCFCVATVTTSFGYPRPRKTTSEFDRRWIAFRDMFGAMWAVRVIERINATAQISNWPISLSWSGFYFHDEKTDWETLSHDSKAELQQAMDNLLRRFLQTSQDS